MTIDELQILLDLNKGNEKAFLEKNCYKVNNSNNRWLFVDSDGNCHLFNKNGKMLNIKMLKCINANMFYGNDRMLKIVIPSSVTSIEVHAFFDCCELMCVTIPDSVTSIMDEAFVWCDSLTNVTIGNSVTSIGWGAFYGCSRLKSLIFKDKTMDQVKEMTDYPWGIEDETVIKAES